MSYRRILLAAFAALFGFLLYSAITADTAAASAAVWPLVAGTVVVLMIPEKRLNGELLGTLLDVLKGTQSD